MILQVDCGLRTHLPIMGPEHWDRVLHSMKKPEETVSLIIQTLCETLSPLNPIELI